MKKTYKIIKTVNKENLSTEEKLFVALTYTTIFSVPFFTKIVNELFNDYKQESWKWYSKSPLKESMYIRTSPIKSYIQMAKFIGVWEYMQHCYDTGKRDIAEKINVRIHNATVLYTGESFFEALFENDVHKMAKYLDRLDKRDITKALNIHCLLWIHNKQLYTELGIPQVIMEELSGNIIDRFDTRWNWFRNEIKSNKSGIIEQKQKYNIDYKEKSNIVLQDKMIDNELSMEIIGIMTGLLHLYGLNFDMIENEFPMEKIDWEILCYYSYKNHYNLPIEWIYIFSCMIVIGKAYDNARKLFFNTNKEFIELEEKQLKDYKKEQKQIEKDFLKEIIKKDLEIERLRKEYKVGLERELIEKDKQIEDLQELLEMFTDKLENIPVENNSVENNSITIDSAENKVTLEPFVNLERITIIGGYPKLQQRLKDYFPNAIFDSGVNRTKGKVFLLTSYLNHSETYSFTANKIDFEWVNSIGVNTIAHEIKSLLKR